MLLSARCTPSRPSYSFGSQNVPITLCYFIFVFRTLCGPGSSVGIATELRDGRSGDRIPVGRDFPPVQTGPGAQPASCTMGTRSFPEVKHARGVLLTTYPLLVPRSLKGRYITLPTLWATTGPVTGTLYLYLYSYIKFHKNPSSESRVVPCGRTNRMAGRERERDRQTDMTNLILTFRSFATAPNNSQVSAVNARSDSYLLLDVT